MIEPFFDRVLAGLGLEASTEPGSGEIDGGFFVGELVGWGDTEAGVVMVSRYCPQPDCLLGKLVLLVDRYRSVNDLWWKMADDLRGEKVGGGYAAFPVG